MKNERLEIEDNFVKTVIKNSDRKVLSDDFETQMMSTIRHTYEHKKEVSSSLKLIYNPQIIFQRY